MANKTQENKNSSKEKKAQVRRQGMKQAAEAVKRMVEPVAKDVAKGVLTGKRPGNIAVDVIKSTLENGTLQDLATGIVKGIFNDDNDYVFNGYKPEFAANSTRPMDIYSLREYLNNMVEGGVPYVSRLNLSVRVAALEEAFSISATKLYGEIRSQLKSNLPYGAATVKAYLQLSVILTTLIAQYKRNLAFASATNGVDVKFNETINSIPDPFEQEFIPISRPDWNNPESQLWAKNRNALIKVNTILQQLYVPNKYYNWINWYFNTVFVDDNSLHRQIYLNDVREMDTFILDKYSDRSPFGVSDVDIKLDGIFDPLMDENPLDRIQNLAQSILDNFAMVIKDIVNKTEVGKSFKQLTIAPETRKLNDPSYFQYLINSYAMGSGMSATALIEAPFSLQEYYIGSNMFGYARYDELPNTPKDKLGPIQGLAALAARKSTNSTLAYKPNCLILPISQSSIVYLAKNMKYLASGENSAVTNLLPIVPEDGTYAASIRSFVDGRTLATISYSEGTEVTANGSASSRLDPSLDYKNNNLSISNDWMNFTFRVNMTESSLTLLDTVKFRTIIADVRGQYTAKIGVELHLDAGTQLSGTGSLSGANLFRYYNDFNSEQVWPIVTSQTLSYVLKRVQSTGSTTALYDITIFAPYDARSTVDISDEIIRAVFVNNPQCVVTYIGAAVPENWRMTYTVSNPATRYRTDMKIDVAHFITSKYDYHIPVYFAKLEAQGAGMVYNGLIKETYRPMLVELDNVSNTLELMMLGLVSII